VDEFGQRGNTLAEAAVAVAILAIVCTAAGGAMLTASHAASGSPATAALQQTVARELAIAVDVLKYDDATVPPASIATSAPMPAGTPLPIQLSIGTASRPDGTLQITIAAEALDGSNARARLEAVVGHRAVLPGAQVVAPQLAPAPTGAP